MIYLESRPSPPLAEFVRSLWYTSAPEVEHRRERVLPNGCIQIVLSLASDQLTDCGFDDGPDEGAAAAGICRPMPGAILVGARSRYEVIHSRDFAELVGIIFRPGGLGPWLRMPADQFFERSIALDSLWKESDLRTRLCEAPTPRHKLALLDTLLRKSLCGRSVARRETVRAALPILSQSSVRETVRSLGVSERRLQQLFREDVGLSPKLWSRVFRFQKAVKALHSGNTLRWEQLALACGYYDQAHFSNDFRAFSGIDPTTYSERKGQWRNHIAID